MNIFGPPNIEKLKNKGNINKLIRALGYKDNHGVRTNAAKALGELENNIAIPDLVLALDDPHAEVRKAAVNALGKIHDESVVDKIAQKLADEDFSVQEATIHVLEKFRWNPSKAQVRALGKFKEMPALDAIAKLLKDEERSIRDEAQKTLPLFLNANNRNVRKKGTMLLGEFKISEAVPELLLALEDPDAEVRVAAVIALNHIHDESVVDKIAQKLSDDDYSVQQAAIYALENFKWNPSDAQDGVIYWLLRNNLEKSVEYGKDAIEILNKLIAHEEKDVRKRVVIALDKLQGKRCKQTLINLLTKEKDREILILTVEFLKEYGWTPRKANLFQNGTAESIYYLMLNWESVSKYIDELIEISKTKAFTESERAKKIGLMQEVFLIIDSMKEYRVSSSNLDLAWNGIKDGKYIWMA